MADFRKFFSVIAGLLITPVFLTGAGTSAANFLKVGVGGRNIAMGEVGAAISEDVNAIFWNPAALKTLSSKEMSFGYARWFEDISWQHLAFAMPVELPNVKFLTSFAGKETLALSLFQSSVPGIEGYTAGDQKTKTFKTSFLNFNAGYAWEVFSSENAKKGKFSNLYSGILFKYIQEDLHFYKASAYAADVGIYWENLNKNREGFKSGLVFQNLGTKMKFVKEADPLPSTGRLGLGYRKYISGLPVTVSADFNFPNDNEFYFSTGGEIVFANILFFRLGWKGGQDIGSGLRAGFGLEMVDFSLDYAWSNFGDLSLTHRISMNYRFEGRKFLVVEDVSAQKQHHWEKGTQFYEAGRYEEAVIEFNAVLELEPAHTEAFRMMKQAYEKMTEKNK